MAGFACRNCEFVIKIFTECSEFYFRVNDIKYQDILGQKKLVEVAEPGFVKISRKLWKMFLRKFEKLSLNHSEIKLFSNRRTNSE